MANYHKTKTNYTENLSVKILLELGINAKRNNLLNRTAVDLIVGSYIRMDVQYSQDFAKWGDLRLDFVSAYFKDDKSFESSLTIEIFKEFEERFGFRVVKVGKYFQDDYLDAVIILFYNNKLNISIEDNYPDKILIITKDELINFLNNNKEKIMKDIKLNHKEDLGDKHGSAFLPVNVGYLQKESTCFFGSIDELKEKSEEIKRYLGV